MQRAVLEGTLDKFVLHSFYCLCVFVLEEGGSICVYMWRLEVTL